MVPLSIRGFGKKTTDVFLFLTGVVRQQPGPSLQKKANIWKDILTATKTHEVRFLCFLVVVFFFFLSQGFMSSMVLNSLCSQV